MRDNRDFVEFLKWLNWKAYTSVLRMYSFVRFILLKHKSDKMVKEFKNNLEENKQYISKEVMAICKSEHPTFVDLQREIRNRYGDKLPATWYATVRDEESNIDMPFVWYSLQYIVNHGQTFAFRKGTVPINNGYGKTYIYKEYRDFNEFIAENKMYTSNEALRNW